MAGMVGGARGAEAGTEAGMADVGGMVVGTVAGEGGKYLWGNLLKDRFALSRFSYLVLFLRSLGILFCFAGSFI